jgi:diguanylate cyclase (GGDEF)-like protein/PAS domain S-box-containing protein
LEIEDISKDIKKKNIPAHTPEISEDEAREYAESIIYTMHEPLIILDQNLKVVFVSPAFYESFKIKPEETLGKVIYELDNKKWDIPKLRELLESILPKKEALRNYEIEHNFNTIGKRVILLNARQINRVLGKERVTILAIEDITSRKKTENKIIYLSYRDQLTGLYNRRYFEEEVKRLDTKRQLPLSIIMADLNGLKLINDTFGHIEGDILLKKAAALLKKACRSDDIIARWGGDEFIVLLPKTSLEFSEMISRRMTKYFKKLIIKNIPLSCAIGIATKIEAGENTEEIIKEAENNMYKNKLLEKASDSWSTISALEQTLFEKSNETVEHTHRVNDNAIKLGKSIKLHQQQLDDLSLLATLHDIGKVAIPESILLKEGKLTEKEWEVIKRHPEIGFNIASSSPKIIHIAKYILSCHENWDGSGYPHKLKGDAISIISRIIYIADAYDVMISKRSYKKALSKKEAIEELRRCSGTQFDPELIEKFIEIISN